MVFASVFCAHENERNCTCAFEEDTVCESKPLPVKSDIQRSRTMEKLDFSGTLVLLTGYQGFGPEWSIDMALSTASL